MGHGGKREGAGAKKGNANSSKDRRLWTNTIKRALAQSDPDRLRRIAETLLNKAEEGDISALKEIGDRLEGKPAQVIIGDDENPVEMVHRVVRVIERATDKDS